jgi:hypothetical protein
VVSGVSVGSDTVTATLSPASPGTATVNVTTPPAGAVKLSGHIVISGNVKLP